MKTPLELALEHARTYVALRGMWCEPLTWEEVRVLLKHTYRIDEDNWNDGLREGLADAADQVAP